MYRLPRTLVFGDSDVADVQCLSTHAVHVHNAWSCFGKALHGRVEGDGICSAIDGGNGHGLERDIGERGRSSFAGGELLVVAEVVGEGYLVVGVHVADDSLFHGRIFGGLVWVCHGIYWPRIMGPEAVSYVG